MDKIPRRCSSAGDYERTYNILPQKRKPPLRLTRNPGASLHSGCRSAAYLAFQRAFEHMRQHRIIYDSGSDGLCLEPR